MISSPIWQISPKGITNSFSRPRNPQTQPGPGTMIARILPVHGSTSRSPTNPSRLQSQTLITSRLFNSLIRIASSPGSKHFMYPINSVLIVQTAVHESYSLYIVYVPILLFEMNIQHYFHLIIIFLKLYNSIFSGSLPTVFRIFAAFLHSISSFSLSVKLLSLILAIAAFWVP